MNETPDDLARLQVLLNASYERAGSHLKEILLPDRRWDWEQWWSDNPPPYARIDAHTMFAGWPPTVPAGGPRLTKRCTNCAADLTQNRNNVSRAARTAAPPKETFHQVAALCDGYL